MAEHQDNLDDLREALHAMHRDVLDAKDKHRRRNKAKSKGAACNFSEGDFVLWPRINSRLSHKLLVRWVGPFEVVEALPHSLDVTEELVAHAGNHGMVLEIEQFKDNRFSQSRSEWQLLVSWVGLQAEEDLWELLGSKASEVPVKVKKYVGGCNSNALKTALA
ncbi:hypothetical protein PHPALM_31304 [Phytophthora palmivora]|uniref:Chromo domain-containing protein n=1 Tax=Phytophthora palmivora TaxID=4796 RepID=A0A2P4X2X9_9STRA|nr:hypothetical protein PHPALM_31304 [Phytophthora palmivora]